MTEVGFSPGIYRDVLARYPPEHIQRILQEMTGAHERREEGDLHLFFSSPDAFVQAWVEGYATDPPKSKIGKYDFQMGFELYFMMGGLPEEGNQELGALLQSSGNQLAPDGLRYILLAEDANGITSHDHMDVYLNDLVNRRGFIFTGFRAVVGEDGIVRGIKRESQEEHGHRFPLHPLNPLKAIDNQWTMVGYHPREFYEAMEQRGFSIR